MSQGAGSALGQTGLSTAMPYVQAGTMVAGGIMNLVEAAAQKDAQNAADRAAREAVAEAKRQQEQNFLGAVQVPTQAYNQALNQATANQMQAVSALQEAGPRELAGGVGRVNAVSNNEINDITNNLADRLYNLNVAQATEQGQTADALAKLSLAQAEGAQKASMAANLANVGLKQNAMGNFTGALTRLDKALNPAYGKQEDVTSPLSNISGPVINQPQMPAVGQIQKPSADPVQQFLQLISSNPSLLMSLGI